MKILSLENTETAWALSAAVTRWVLTYLDECSCHRLINNCDFGRLGAMKQSCCWSRNWDAFEVVNLPPICPRSGNQHVQKGSSSLVIHRWDERTSYGVPAGEKSSDSPVTNCAVKDSIGRPRCHRILPPEGKRSSAVHLSYSHYCLVVTQTMNMMRDATISFCIMNIYSFMDTSPGRTDSLEFHASLSRWWSQCPVRWL